MTSPTKFYCVILTILQMGSCDQSLALAFLWEKHSNNFIRIWPEKTFFWGYAWVMFNNLGLALGIALKFSTGDKKKLKLKVRTFWGLIHTFVEVAGKKLVERAFLPPLTSWIGLKEVWIALFWFSELGLPSQMSLTASLLLKGLFR